MRYLNWDVLLFPAGSKVPLQEFKTGCYVVQDHEFHASDTVSGSGRVFERVSNAQVPIVACFLADQSDGSPFRVSVHSWEQPSPTPTLQLVIQHGKSVCFEARVFIDGLCTAGMLFFDQGPWPQVIEMSSQMDKEGNRDFLRWPLFYPEMLTQSYWNAGENKGRIKVTITEGYLQAPGILPFTRTKNLASFSFQHAPQQVLENAGIAWPNAGMWYQPAQPLYSMTSPAKQDQSSEELELHAHSPRRRADSMAGIQERMGAKMPTHPNMNRVIQPPMVMQSSAMQELSIENHSTAWNSLTQMPDPFVEGSRHLMHNHYAARSTKSDLSMPDYSQSITPSSSRNATNDFHGNVGPVGTVQSHETIFGDFPALFNADNDGISGVVAPANTRVSSATNTPPISSRPSAAAEARAASYSKERSRAISITTKDVPPKPRETSDVSMKSQFSEDIINSKETANTKLHTQPASEVKGRKEGRAAELDVPNHLQKKASNSSIGSTGSKKENTTARITTTIVLSDGKRKRTTTIPRLSSKDEEDLGSSPTVKAAKKKSSKTRLLDPVCAMGPMVDGKTDPRPPLGSIDNIL